MKFEASEELSKYFKEVESTSAPLTQEEEAHLIPLAKAGDQFALNRVVNSCAKMVVKTANHYMGQGVPVMDLVQEGNLGTIEALTRYNPEEKSKFATYAQLWIKKYINDSVATVGRTVRLPMNKEFEIFKLKKAGKEVENLSNVSLDKPVQVDSKVTIGDVYLRDISDTEKNHELEYTIELSDYYLNKVNKVRDREMLKAYFGIGRDYPLNRESISEEFGVSEIRVSQIVNNTIKKLRDNV